MGVITHAVLFASLLLFVGVSADIEVTESEKEEIIETTSATTEFLAELTPFGLYFLKVTVVKHVFEKIFVVQLTVTDVPDVYYSNALYFGKETGAANPEKLAEDVANAAKKAYQENMSPLEYFRTISDVFEQSAKQKGLLNDDNAQDLIDDYTNQLQKAAESEDYSNPKAPVRALAIGSANFLKSKEINSPKDVGSVGRNFANKLRQHAGGAADSAAGLLSGRIEISYLLTFMILLKCIVWQKL